MTLDENKIIELELKLEECRKMLNLTSKLLHRSLIYEYFATNELDSFIRKIYGEKDDSE